MHTKTGKYSSKQKRKESFPLSTEPGHFKALNWTGHIYTQTGEKFMETFLKYVSKIDTWSLCIIQTLARICWFRDRTSTRMITSSKGRCTIIQFTRSIINPSLRIMNSTIFSEHLCKLRVETSGSGAENY